MSLLTRILLIVIILAAAILVGFDLGPVAVWIRGIPEKAHVQRARLEISSLEQAVNAYHLKKGFFPENLEMLTILVGPDTPFLNSKKRLIDTWGNPYLYEPPFSESSKPLIYTNGPPGKNKRIMNLE